MSNRLITIVVLAIVGLGLLARFGRHGIKRSLPAIVAPQVKEPPNGIPPLSMPSARPQTLVEARRKHPTILRQTLTDDAQPDPPPTGVFDLVHYVGQPGVMPAYLTPDPEDGRRHPAIIWIHGGNSNPIGDCWHPAKRANDQTAAAYRKAGVVMMVPALRGGSGGAGSFESYFGEVDDVVAAADFLAKQPWVDPDRLYLGGHSTGGTMALLTAEVSDRFRAVFSFGPVADVGTYDDPQSELPYDKTDQTEVRLRSPGYWLGSVRSPTFVLEGAAEPSNRVSVEGMRDRSRDLPLLHWAVVPGRSHFSILAPANELIARKILADDGPTTNIAFTAADIDAISGQ